MDGDGEKSAETVAGVKLKDGTRKRFWQTDVQSLVPGASRYRGSGKRSDGQVGALVDAFAAFATLDDVLSAVEADLILDMLRSAFPEVDHAWLTR
jgi:hypothetical protein